MTTTNEPQDPRQPAGADSPGDTPAGRPAALSRLDALLGSGRRRFPSRLATSAPAVPGRRGRGGRTRFTWLDGEFFLIQRFTAGNPTAPSGIAITGPGETAETFCQPYYDSRGVARI